MCAYVPLSIYLEEVRFVDYVLVLYVSYTYSIYKNSIKYIAFEVDLFYEWRPVYEGS
jgi:hypothetical protein